MNYISDVEFTWSKRNENVGMKSISGFDVKMAAKCNSTDSKIYSERYERQNTAQTLSNIEKRWSFSVFHAFNSVFHSTWLLNTDL